MPERKNPDTSIAAYKSLRIEELTDTYKLIIDALKRIGQGTFEDIAVAAKKDKSVIWKRLSEMERMEIIHRPGLKKKLQSGRSGYVWQLTSDYLPKTEKIFKRKSLTNDSPKKYSQQGLF